MGGVGGVVGSLGSLGVSGVGWSVSVIKGYLLLWVRVCYPAPPQTEREGVAAAGSTALPPSMKRQTPRHMERPTRPGGVSASTESTLFGPWSGPRLDLGRV